MDSSQANTHAIQDLKAKTQYHEQETIRLKHFRNPLPNLSVCLAPEILGHIFWWSVISGVNPSGRIAGNTFNFLLVCHYWYDVATSTPPIWAFWGTSVRECVAFRRYSGAVPLYVNLVDVNTNRDIREACGVLQDWSVLRRIRHLHVHSSPRALANILSFTSTPQPSYIRSQIQSLKLTVEGPWTTERPEEFPDITNFLNIHSLPELQSLRLRGCNMRWDSLIPQTSKLTHLLVHAHVKSRKPTVLQLAALFAGNSALEDIDLSLEIASTPEDSLLDSSITVLLPHLRCLVVHGNAVGHTQLLNLLTFSNGLKHVNIDIFLDGIVTDVAAALTPFLPNLFLTCRPCSLAVQIVYALAGLSINVSRPGEQGDAEDFLILKISSFDVGFWEIAPTLPEEVAKRLPTANITSLSIRRYSAMFRQDFRCLFKMVSAVQELRVTDSAINDIVQILASPPPTGEGEPTPLPHLRTFRLKDVNFALTSHVGTAAHLGRLLEQRCQAGIPLSKLSLAYCPHFSWNACAGFGRYLKDHFCCDRYESPGDRRRVCETCHTRWSDLD